MTEVEGTDVFDSVRCYRIATVAERLEMSKVWVYEQIKAGALPTIDFGTTRPHQRVRADDLQAFIDTHSLRGRA